MASFQDEIIKSNLLYDPNFLYEIFHIVIIYHRCVDESRTQDRHPHTTIYNISMELIKRKID